MLRLTQAVPAAIRGQVCLSAVRLRSTVTAVNEDVREDTASTDWEQARPYSAIPGPTPLPILGNAHHFMPPFGKYNGINLADVMKSFNVEYGPVAKLGGLPGRADFIIISEPHLIEQVLRTEGVWPMRKGADSLEYYFRNIRKNYRVSLASSQGQEWQEFRTAVNQVMMKPQNTKQYVEPIDRVSQEFVDRIRAMRDGNNELPDQFFDEISKWALESITYVALDTKLGLLRGDLDPNSESYKMIDAVHTVFESMYKLDFLPSLWKQVSTPTYRKFIKSMNFFTEMSTKYVNMAMERLQSTPRSELEDRPYSVLENLLLRTEDPNMAVAMALDMLLAGVDTTGTVVATFLYQLATHPEQQQKLQEELDRVIPDINKPLTKEQLEDMRYLRACIKETMRTMPIILGNARNAGKDLVLGGYQIPEGTLMMMTYRGLFDNEKYFPRAKEFLPERWLPGGEALKCKHPFAFLPFGFGVRKCVGKRFADLEMETVLAKTFRNFSVEWNRPPANTTFHFILKFLDPLKFTVKDRV